MREEYAAIVITPDAIRDGLAERILHDLLASITMRILGKKLWRIVSMDTIVSMYPTQFGKSTFAPMAKALMSGDCLVVIVCGENLCMKLREAKGKLRFNKDFTELEMTGLRLKYSALSLEELKQLKNLGYRNHQELLDKIFEFRLHTTDNLKETANLCILCMDDMDMDDLKIAAPFLCEEIMRLKNETA